MYMFPINKTLSTMSRCQLSWLWTVLLILPQLYSNPLSISSITVALIQVEFFFVVPSNLWIRLDTSDSEYWIRDVLTETFECRVAALKRSERVKHSSINQRKTKPENREKLSRLGHTHMSFSVKCRARGQLRTPTHSKVLSDKRCISTGRSRLSK